MSEKHYVFYDLQTGDYSAHTTLAGLAENLADDRLAAISADELYPGEYEEQVERWKNPSEKMMRDIIQEYEYEILPENAQNVAEYEKYWNRPFYPKSY